VAGAVRGIVFSVYESVDREVRCGHMSSWVGTAVHAHRVWPRTLPSHLCRRPILAGRCRLHSGRTSRPHDLEQTQRRPNVCRRKRNVVLGFSQALLVVYVGG